MAEENKDQKTEEPTTKRIQDSQEKGNFANSRELSSSFILLTAILAFFIVGRTSMERLLATWRQIFGQSHSINLSVVGLYDLFRWILENIFLVLSPILFTIMIGGVIANLIQTGGLRFSAHPLLPKFNKLNPLTGVKRIFSVTALMELFKSIFKIAVISLVAYFTIKSRFHEIPPMMGLSVGQILSFMGQVGLEIMVKVLMLMIILAFIDFSFQKYNYTKNLRMTKQEVKDERKDTEGNPQIKQRIRNVQLEMARKRMMAAVPEADVVVTNPTRISVAIKYDNKKYSAPIVVAKGMGFVAQKIREIANENEVPLVEDKPLARVLYRTVEVGQLVPSNLFKAVAEILAYVYKLKGKSPV